MKLQSSVAIIVVLLPTCVTYTHQQEHSIKSHDNRHNKQFIRNNNR